MAQWVQTPHDRRLTGDDLRLHGDAELFWDSMPEVAALASQCRAWVAPPIVIAVGPHALSRACRV